MAQMHGIPESSICAGFAEVGGGPSQQACGKGCTLWGVPEAATIADCAVLTVPWLLFVAPQEQILLEWSAQLLGEQEITCDFCVCLLSGI